MNYPLRTIVVGIAELEKADPVLEQAVELALPHGSVLHLVHSFELPAVAWDIAGASTFSEPIQTASVADTLTEKMEAIAERSGRGLTIHCHAVARPAAWAIRDIAEENQADLIVVGATRHGSVGRLLLGTTAQRVLRGAQIPVYVVRRPLKSGLARVLLTTDLSDFSAAVHEHGLDVLATLLEGEDVEVRSLMGVAHPSSLPVPLTLGNIEEVAERKLEAFLDMRRERDFHIEPVVRFGQPSDAIREYSEDWRPDLVVVGTHSRPTLERWVFGSVAEATTRDARSNVLVIPAAAAASRHLPVAQTREHSEISAVTS